MSEESTKTGAEIFQYLEENFSKGGIIQYRISDMEAVFTGKELKALTKLFENYQPGWGTIGTMPAAIDASEKEAAIAYLDKHLGVL